MRAYVIVTGICFALLAVVHVLRFFAEGEGPLRSPIFIVSTLIAVALAGWAAALLFGSRTPKI